VCLFFLFFFFYAYVSLFLLFLRFLHGDALDDAAWVTGALLTLGCSAATLVVLV